MRRDWQSLVETPPQSFSLALELPVEPKSSLSRQVPSVAAEAKASDRAAPRPIKR